MKKNAAGLNVAGSENPNWKGGMVTKACEQCGAEFTVIPSRTESARCCTLPCWNDRQRYLNSLKPPKPPRPAWKNWSLSSSLPIVERMQARSALAEESGCREWTHRKNEQGYGLLQYGNRPWLAHRLAWTLEKGDIPSGMLVCHHCDNPCCINTGHLFLGTNDDNMKDMVAKGRARSGGTFGEEHGHAKLTAAQVKAIREALPAEKYSKSGIARKLARHYGVSEGTIANIKSGKTWKQQG